MVDSTFSLNREEINDLLKVDTGEKVVLLYETKHIIQSTWQKVSHVVTQSSIITSFTA